MKLDILTHLVDEGNISKLLREFASYVKHEDKRFVRATVQAIGRCATRIPAVLDSCIASLMRLLTNRNEAVVAEAVIVLKRLLQTPAAAENEAVIRQLARLLDSIAVPTARAAITWLCGEYHARIAPYAPDVLRQLARSFALEDTQVKLQVLTLGAKLFAARPDDVRALFEYVLTLAKYDQSYDVRDRARLVRALLLGDSAPSLAAHAKRLLETVKPVPVWRSEFAARAQWQLGTLTHVLGQELDGYEPLPEWPSEPSDRSLRDAELDVTSIGQSMSSDTGRVGYVPESHQGRSAYSTPGGDLSASIKAGSSGAAVAGDDLDSFYNDDDENGEFWGEEGEDEGYYDEGGYYSDGGTWYDEGGYYSDGGTWYDEGGYYSDGGTWYDEGEEGEDGYYYDDEVAAADDAYLAESGDLPPLAGVDDFVPEGDDNDAFFS